MAKKSVKSVNLLPEFLRTDKNSKFLSSTLDQWIQPPSLERIDGYVGSKITPTYNSTSDVYISESLPLRKDYQLEPAIIIKDSVGTIESATGFDDLVNEISTKGGINDNLDRLFRTEFYTYNPNIDWDKLVNYNQYYWLVNGPDTVLISGSVEVPIGEFNVETGLIGKKTFTSNLGVTLSNGMKIKFGKNIVPLSYQDNEFWVEGVGNAIRLINVDLLKVSESMLSFYDANFDGTPFDDYPFDNFRTLPTTPEYITINRGSRDLNPWSRYNRWVHADVIRISAEANGVIPVYPTTARALRPIVEFNADLKLYNFGVVGVPNVDFIDNTTKDAFTVAEGTPGYYVDGVLLDEGNTVIFNADTDSTVRNKIYRVNYITNALGKSRLTLTAVNNFEGSGQSLSVNYGKKYKGTSWWFNGDSWQYAQQHDTLNQAPLFDVFDSSGQSYGDVSSKSNFTGTKIFGYDIGTGNDDTILGFPLKYKNSVGVGSYLFKNYFSTDSMSVSINNIETIDLSVSQTFLKYSYETGDEYVNVWIPAEHYNVPILQFQVLSTATNVVEINAIDDIHSNFTFDVIVNNKKFDSTKYTTSISKGKYLVNFVDTIDANASILFKIYSSSPANENGYYDVPLGLTNNPLNGLIESFTLSELSDHLESSVSRSPEVIGVFPGISNLRDISNPIKYGTRLISNINPLPFAQLFIGRREHSVIDAINKVSDQYNQFKMEFLNKSIAVDNQLDPISAVDSILTELNQTKNLNSPYYLSDMIAYGNDKITRSWTVTNNKNTIYPIISDFDPLALGLRSVLVYLNGVQLILGRDYEFITNDSSINVLIPLSLGDTLVINDYPNTSGSYIPPTPSKLGLYPKFEPTIFVDDTYITPTLVIQGHDGSITVAYNDYRDNILLELESRIYNNIKSNYRSELFDINSVIPGNFRTTEYSEDEIIKLLTPNFLKWVGFYGVDYITNSSFDEQNLFTYNYTNTYSKTLNKLLVGSWRSVYKSLYGTDRPHTCPWEMLGFSMKPSWWESQYGPAPYTSGNQLLWDDLETGTIKDPTNVRTNSLYARTGLSNILPVDEDGMLVNPETLLALDGFTYNGEQNWSFGQLGPSETAWRRSSYWPFAVQRMLALAKPATYAALMYDPINMIKNISDQWTYGTTDQFLNIKSAPVFNKNSKLTSGYSVFVSEVGTQRDSSYTDILTDTLTYLDVNLFHKVGGFVNKNNIQVVIDAYEPTSLGPGALLPQENYNLILNTSNPVETIGISGVIIQKSNGKFLVNGYDKSNPYFNVYSVVLNNNSPTLTIGGTPTPYLNWEPSISGGNTGLNAIDTTTASSAATGKLYRKGQIVSYGGRFYIVKLDHKSESVFNPSFYQSIPSLPIVGGAIVQTSDNFDKSVIKVSYGTTFDTVQDVYNFIVGYGAWLTDQGFIFDQYNSDLGSVLDWGFSGKEFLYWSTQNWGDNSVITLSPFSAQFKFQFKNTVIDNIFDSFYEYNILQQNGFLFPKKNLNVSREDGICTISTINTNQGIYFAQLNCVQKEHAMVFDNTTIFNDVIYDIQTGYRQRRMQLIGFRTSQWDGDYFTPGFVYDIADSEDWVKYKSYLYGKVVRFNSKYYSAIQNVEGTEKFDFTKWVPLGSKPVADLIPNFDYKINQFEDFYSLDIDNFDANQQRLAQHLVGYTPRVYLDNIFINPIAQYKFYQGFIREKGTKNSITKLSKSSIHNLQGSITFNEEWAFRIGNYGSYETYQELEFPLVEGTFKDNPQAISLVSTHPNTPNDIVNYVAPTDFIITPSNYSGVDIFVTTSTNNFELATAGYVHLDDINATVYNEANLTSITNNQDLNDGDYIWLGFRQDNSWDVYQYQRADAELISVVVTSPGEEIQFSTNNPHNLNEGDLISITQFDSQVNGVYKVTGIPTINDFTVASSLEFILPFDVPLIGGLLFKFSSCRYNEFDNIPSDQELFKLPIGSKFWIDNDGNWVVYQKTQNFNISAINTNTSSSSYGWNINKIKGTGILLEAAISFTATTKNDIGTVVVKNVIDNSAIFNYNLNENLVNEYYLGTTITEFGQSLFYDPNEFNSSGYGIFFTGAPGTSDVKGTLADLIRIDTTSTTSSGLIQQGVVKISTYDSVTYHENSDHTFVITSPTPKNYERFGQSIYVQTNETSTKTVLIGAPTARPPRLPHNINTGTVYHYVVTATSSLTAAFIDKILPPANKNIAGSEWGYSIAGSDDATTIAISSPGWSNSIGYVAIYKNSNFTTPSQIIESPFLDENSKFGHDVLFSSDNTYLLITAPFYINYSSNGSIGAVAVYKLGTDLTYKLYQLIYNPISTSKMSFGMSIDINSDNTEIVISALGIDKVPEEFDNFLSDGTTFDFRTTHFNASIANSGSVYVYARKNNRFIFAEEINPGNYSTSTNFGKSITLDDNILYVGAPNNGINDQSSGVFRYEKVYPNIDSWQILRKFDNLVEPNTLERVSLIDTFNETIAEYLDVIDPVKGKIAGIADQELKYKSVFDPATYTVGSTDTVNDPTTNWLDKEIGHLWWDLSTLKYVWYEQGDTVYRKNNWGKLFPGSSVDVYEWVESSYLPSEWSKLADTPAGLILGISGQPKYVDDSVLSAKQSYDPITNTFNNRYYYWVKNKTTVPSVKNRRISAYQVAAVISDPANNNIIHANVLSSNSIALSNVSPILVGSRINLNISFDTIQNQIPRHTEWLLLQEGVASSVPNTLLEKKFIDSLIGHDSLGNPVPDPSLSQRVRYGIGIRPQQSIFKNRLEALRNLIEFANSIFQSNLITGKYSFENLNAQEEIPDEYSYAYDQIGEDNEFLNIIDVKNKEQAELSCMIKNGKIIKVDIVNSGFGYLQAPKVTIVGNCEESAVITTEIDSLGRVISTTIEKEGTGYQKTPLLDVRPYTVVILSDSNSNGKWAIFSWRKESNEWIRERTQKYNTPLYWEYIDWASSDYRQYQDYTYTIESPYQLYTLVNILTDQYVKVRNIGDGNYAVLKKTDNTTSGTFGNGFDIVYKENGTVQISNSIWDLVNSPYSFDEILSYDQTLYDQTPDIELQYILSALKNDIFINELKVNWNLFFFKAVKYALTEQKLLDWAFKTSFISVVNTAGALDQRPVYKLQNTKYFEDYISEVKPYRSQIRGFTTEYSVNEYFDGAISDFDLPGYYDSSKQQFSIADSSKLNEYPWKSWNDNHSFMVESISVGNSGAGYTTVPLVEVRAKPGDAGTGATAVAYISSGAVSSIEITDPGYGYLVPPDIIIKGGGSTTLTTATAYARLINGKVRSNLIGMKFDRINRSNEIGDTQVTDTFICNGNFNEYVLNWLAEPDKSLIKITLDKVRVLSADYTVKYYTQEYNGYQKKYSKIVFLNYTPNRNQILKVTYQKSKELFTAIERIEHYYQPTSGMPGNTATLLMSGFEYPSLQIQGLSFTDTANWDILFGTSTYSPFGVTSYADDISSYQTLSLAHKVPAGANTLILNDTTGLTAGQFVNIISTTTNQFNTSTVFIKSVDHNASSVKLSARVLNTLTTATIEVWSYDSNSNRLDSSIDGGTWTPSKNGPILIDALGINPEDLILNGSNFYSPEAGYGPEEFIGGQVTESLGINVYTKNPNGAPLVFSGFFDVDANQPVVHPLRLLPTTYNSISVTFGRMIYDYVEDSAFTAINQFSIDWATGDLVLPPQSSTGQGSYTILEVGGGNDKNPLGVIDKQYISVDNTGGVFPYVEVDSLAWVKSVKSAYVTVNGIEITSDSTKETYYVLGASNKNSTRASVTVYGLPKLGVSVQSWFFGSYNNYYNKVQEEVFAASTVTQTSFTLTNLPATIEPADSQVIVEIKDSAGRRQLTPPYVSYYQVKDISTIENRTFSINNKVTHSPGTYSLNKIRVYKNGKKLVPGFEFVLNGPDNTVTIYPSVLKIGDAIAILGIIPGEYDYDIISNTLYVPLISGSGVTNAEIKIITFTDHDGMLMRTEKFPRVLHDRYQLSRPVMNTSYIWVSLNGIPLKHSNYDVLEDMVTVQLNDSVTTKPGDVIVIRSLSDLNMSSTVLGYRIFNDIFGRSHYKRLSKENTTYLTSPLSYTDTEIKVADAKVLSPPILSKKIPGVILIDGERIEFLEMSGNTLKKLRRGTLGTSPSFYSDINTKVIDQSPTQTIPYSEILNKNVIYTTASVNTYALSTITTSVTNQAINFSISSDGKIVVEGCNFYTGASFIAAGDGTLSTKPNVNAGDLVVSPYIPSGTYVTDVILDWPTDSLNGQWEIQISNNILDFSNNAGYYGGPLTFVNASVLKDNNLSAANQINVFYGGRLLSKVGTFHQDTTISYDNLEFTVLGSVDAVENLSQNKTSIGDAYIVTATNQVWVYTNSTEFDSVNGFVNKGLTYIAPEFTIDTVNNTISLNLEQGVQDNIELLIIQKQYSQNSNWNNTATSLLNSTTEPAKFLKARPAELPDKWYYGGDPTLTTERGDSLNDNDDSPLTGF